MAPFHALLVATRTATPDALLCRRVSSDVSAPGTRSTLEELKQISVRSLVQSGTGPSVALVIPTGDGRWRRYEGDIAKMIAAIRCASLGARPLVALTRTGSEDGTTWAITNAWLLHLCAREQRAGPFVLVYLPHVEDPHLSVPPVPANLLAAIARAHQRAESWERALHDAQVGARWRLSSDWQLVHHLGAMVPELRAERSPEVAYISNSRLEATALARRWRRLTQPAVLIVHGDELDARQRWDDLGRDRSRFGPFSVLSEREAAFLVTALLAGAPSSRWAGLDLRREAWMEQANRRLLVVINEHDGGQLAPLVSEIRHRYGGGRRLRILSALRHDEDHSAFSPLLWLEGGRAAPDRWLLENNFGRASAAAILHVGDWDPAGWEGALTGLGRPVLVATPKEKKLAGLAAASLVEAISGVESILKPWIWLETAHNALRDHDIPSRMFPRT